MGRGPFNDILGIMVPIIVVASTTMVMGSILSNITNMTESLAFSVSSGPEDQMIPMDDGPFRSQSPPQVVNQEVKQEAADYCYLISKRNMYEQIYEEPMRSEKIEEINKLIMKYNGSLQSC